jgi:tetratricopeptide (TPR) repeat protein
MAEAHPVPPLKVFISYSHKDELLRERFLIHLRQLRREGLIELWHDRCIVAGGDWAGTIDENLNSAHIVILLVSADFLASEYCHDVEMKRALKRSRTEATRLLPVILKPCDWQTSLFAKCQALPKEGKPVVDWATEDHGFDDVIKGLRRCIAELCELASAGDKPLQTEMRRHPWRWAVGGLLVTSLIVASWLWSSEQRYLRQGTDLLNIGRYADARGALQQAKRLNPFSGKAGCGLEAVELNAVRSDKVEFERRLGQASREYPNCAWLEVLAGDDKYSLQDREGALAEYRNAAKHEPQLAEAYFNIGVILDFTGRPDSAFEQYQTAVRLSPGTARYRNNLADLYFRREDYREAIAEYGQIDRFPVAAIDVAKIYRLQGKLEDARGREEDAILWLKDLSIQKNEEQTPWAFDVSPVEKKQLRLIHEKQCYADLELAVTSFLQGNEGEAASTIPLALARCGSRAQEVKQILNWELRRLGNEVPAFTQLSNAIVERFLISGH